MNSGLGDSTSENSLIPHDGININHVSNIDSVPHFDPHFNDFCLQYNNFNNSNQNHNSTETGSIAFTNHLQSFTDHNFVNDISNQRANFNFQPSSSSLPSSYEHHNIYSEETVHQMLPLNNNVIQSNAEHFIVPENPKTKILNKIL